MPPKRKQDSARTITFDVPENTKKAANESNNKNSGKAKRKYTRRAGNTETAVGATPKPASILKSAAGHGGPSANVAAGGASANKNPTQTAGQSIKSAMKQPARAGTPASALKKPATPARPNTTAVSQKQQPVQAPAARRILSAIAPTKSAQAQPRPSTPAPRRILSAIAPKKSTPAAAASRKQEYIPKASDYPADLAWATEPQKKSSYTSSFAAPTNPYIRPVLPVHPSRPKPRTVADPNDGPNPAKLAAALAMRSEVGPTAHDDKRHIEAAVAGKEPLFKTVQRTKHYHDGGDTLPVHRAQLKMPTMPHLVFNGGGREMVQSIFAQRERYVVLLQKLEKALKPLEVRFQSDFDAMKRIKGMRGELYECLKGLVTLLGLFVRTLWDSMEESAPAWIKYVESARQSAREEMLQCFLLVGEGGGAVDIARTATKRIRRRMFALDFLKGLNMVFGATMGSPVPFREVVLQVWGTPGVNGGRPGPRRRQTDDDTEMVDA